MRYYHSKNKAFTLIEMLVAMSILTLVALMANGALSTMLNGFRHHKASQSGFTKLQNAILVMERDLLHGISMPHQKTSTNDGTYMNLVKNADGLTLWFVRSGWYTEHQQTSGHHLKRIGIQFSGGSIYRLIEDFGFIKQGLLSNIDSVTYRFLDQDRMWHSTWPASGNQIQTLPKAIEMVINIHQMGTIRRLIELSSNSHEQNL